MISFQEECWFDCKVASEEKVGGRVIANPECLLDCFDNLPCAREVIEKYIEKGVCPDAITPATILLEEQDINIWTHVPANPAACSFGLKFDEFPPSDAADICGYECQHVTIQAPPLFRSEVVKVPRTCGVKCTGGSVPFATLDTAITNCGYKCTSTATGTVKTYSTRQAAEADCNLDADSGIDGSIFGQPIPCGYKVYDGDAVNIKRKFIGKTKEIKRH